MDGGSLLRCDYYHEYLACEEEDFSERYILPEGNWELLSGERLVILLKIAQKQLNVTWEASQIRSMSNIVSENKSISLVWVMELNIISSCLGKVKVFLVILLCSLVSTVNVWMRRVNGWVFVYELSGCGIDFCCSYVNIRYRACFEQRAPWYSGNDIV